MATLKVDKEHTTYKLAHNENNLTTEDEKRVFKLAKRIEEGKSIAKKLMKYDNVGKILLVEMVYQDKGRKDIFTLLHYAKFCKNNQAIKDLLEEAKKQRIFEEVNDKNNLRIFK